MNSKYPRRGLLLFFLVVFSCLLLAGCGNQNGPKTTPTPEVTVPPATPTSAPAEIIWVDAQNSSDDALTSIITQFAAENSLQYRTLTTLTGSDLTSGTQIVVFASDPGNLSEISNAAPSTQFVVLGSSSLAAGGNLSTIQSKPVDEAFMAGYLTMLLARDWRAAALLTSDGPLGDSYADAFVNGSRFVCGKCNPYFAPIISFPAISSEPKAADETTWTNDAVTLGQTWLSSVYIDPAAASIPVANALSAYPLDYESVTFIGTSDVAADNGIQWDALLSSDYAPALKTVLPMVLADQGGNQLTAQVILTSVNEEVVSPARQALFKKTAADLAAGLIEPLSIP